MLMSMKHTKKMQRLLERMAAIERMERGKVCQMGGRPHYNHQTWQDGKNGSSRESVGKSGLKQVHPAILWLNKPAIEWRPKDSRDAVEDFTESRRETQGLCVRNALLWN